MSERSQAPPPFWRTKSLGGGVGERVGKPVRRLRALLPGQPRGRRKRQNPSHGPQLYAARRQNVPMQGLFASAAATGARIE